MTFMSRMACLECVAKDYDTGCLSINKIAYINPDWGQFCGVPPKLVKKALWASLNSTLTKLERRIV